MLRLSSIILLASLVCGTAAPVKAQSHATELLLDKARLLEARGRLDLAAQTWKQVLIADPNQQEALAGMARAARQRGAESEAKAFLERLRRVNPNHPAIPQMESTVPDNQERGELERAAKLAQSHRYEEAMAIYRQLFGNNPPPGEWAIAYYETDASTPGGWERATAGLRRLLARYPESSMYRLSLGKLLTYRPSERVAGMNMLQSIGHGDAYEKQAQAAWRQALTWENGSAASAPSLRAYLARYEDSELSKLLSQAQNRRPASHGSENGPELKAAYDALKAGRLEDAESRFHNILKKSPKDAGALAGLGYVWMKKQDFASALESLEAAKAQMPGDKELQKAIEDSRYWMLMRDATKALDAQRGKDAEAFYEKALALRPSDAAALQGFIGALMQRGDVAAAAPPLEHFVRVQPDNVDAWRMLVNAKYQKSGAQVALSTAKLVPPAVSAKLGQDLQYQLLLSSICRDAGIPSESRRAFQKAALLAKGKKELPEPVELQLASLYVQYGDPVDAEVIYQRLLDDRPENLDAWEGLMLSMLKAKNYSRALKSLEELPAAARNDALARPGFLRAVAGLQLAVGNTGTAETLMRRALELESAGGAVPSFYTQQQLAQIWLDQGQDDRAIWLFTELTRNYPDNPDGWKGLVLALHRGGRDEDALDVSRRIPPDTNQLLEDDSDFLSLLASLYQATGQTGEALRLARQAVARFQGAGQQVPADLAVQLGWLLLNTEENPRELFGLLRDARTRNDLSLEQRQAVTDILTAWVLRGAAAATAARDSDRAISILEAALRVLPSEQRVRRALAGSFLSSGDSRRALELFKTAGLRNASAADYTAAVGSALAERDVQTAENWLREGLRKYPREAELLNIAGRQAAAKGDFRNAERYLRSALDSVQAQERKRASAATLAQNDELESLLVGDAGAPRVVESPSPANHASARPADSLAWLLQPSAPDLHDARPEPAQTTAPRATGENGAGVTESAPAWDTTARKAHIALAVDRGESRAADRLPLARPKAKDNDPGTGNDPLMDLLNGDAPAGLPKPGENFAVAPAGGVPEHQKIEDELKVMEGRNTPHLGIGGFFQARSGQPGFDRMIVQETDLEASTVVSNQVRFSLLAKGIFLNSPAPDGQSTLRFGLLPAGDTFEAQAVSGLGAEVQLSTMNFGMHFGATPRGFPVKNLLGGIRFQPAGGPITLQFERDSVKDSILSFAGAQDPVSHMYWGGVVDNAASVAGNWGSEKSGAYFSTAFHELTGKDVAANQRVDGTLGVYWRLASLPAGSLTAGANLFAMHYAKNLRYFTLGQGGYFSPQRFVLFGVPVNWTGNWRHLQYLASTSIGSQSFSEDASAYFPTQPNIQGKAGPYYPRYSSSGTNYNVDFRLAYQLAPNWYVGGFFNANNARFYTLQSAGIFVRYSLRERPLDTDLKAPSLPDWKGKQPFGLP